MLSNHKEKIRDIVCALSLAFLVLCKQWNNVFSWVLKAEDLGKSSHLYESLSLTLPALLALPITALILALLFLFILSLGRRWGSKGDVTAHLLLALFFLYGLYGLRILANTTQEDPFEILSAKYLLPLTLFTVLVLGYRWRKKPERFLMGFRRLLCCFSPIILICLFHAYSRLSHFPPALLPKRTASNETRYRVVVLLFDRWGYEVSFANNKETLPPLPTIQNLEKKFLSFTHAIPPGSITSESIPSLFLGKRIEGPMVWNPQKGLVYRFPGENVERTWNSQGPHLFQRLKEKGITSGLVGYYLPYCAMLEDTVLKCLRYPHHSQNRYRYAPTIPENIRNYFLELGIINYARNKLFPEHVKEIIKNAEAMLVSPDYDFLFLHFPFPHPPSVFNPDTNTIENRNSNDYFENLQLTDRTLDSLLSKITNSPLGKKTFVIMTADHSNYGPYDERVPFLIRFPENNEPAKIESQFNLVNLDDLALAMLQGKISTLTELKRWIEGKL